MIRIEKSLVNLLILTALLFRSGRRRGGAGANQDSLRFGRRYFHR